MVRLPGNSVFSCIEYHYQQDPDAPCLSLWRNDTWTMHNRGEFWAAVERYTLLFLTSAAPSSLILFIKRFDFDLLAAFVGAMRAGCVPAQLSPHSAKVSVSEYQRKLAHVLQLTEAKGIFADSGSVFPEVSVPVFTPESRVTAPASGVLPESPYALVQFSSGTTGLQKGVLLSHAGVIAHMKAYAEALRLSPSDKLVSWLPLYHDMGLIACYLMPLMCGVPAWLMDPFDWILRPDLLLEAIETQRATICFLPNFAYHILIGKGKPRDLSSMRLFVNCSEPTRPRTHQDFLRKFPSVDPHALTICYALAENTFAVSQTPIATPVSTRYVEGKEVHSCGRVLPGTEVRILDQSEQGIGEIGIRGDYLFERYLGHELPLDDGFYRTGDLGFLSEDGELFITGRKKDLLIINGKNIYPQDVEQCCNTLPGVYPGRSVAFGVINEATGSEELFIIVERDGAVADPSLKLAIQRAVEGEVGIVPRRVEVVDHMRLVKTSSGKISRSRNKELYLQGEFR